MLIDGAILRRRRIRPDAGRVIGRPGAPVERSITTPSPEDHFEDELWRADQGRMVDHMVKILIRDVRTR